MSYMTGWLWVCVCVLVDTGVLPSGVLAEEELCPLTRRCWFSLFLLMGLLLFNSRCFGSDPYVSPHLMLVWWAECWASARCVCSVSHVWAELLLQREEMISLTSKIPSLPTHPPLILHPYSVRKQERLMAPSSDNRRNVSIHTAPNHTVTQFQSNIQDGIFGNILVRAIKKYHKISRVIPNSFKFVTIYFINMFGDLFGHRFCTEWFTSGAENHSDGQL